MFKKSSLLFLFILLGIGAVAQIPDGYYNDAIGKRKSELKTALHATIRHASVLSYGSGATSTWSGFAVADVRPDGSVWDMYSNIVRQFNGVQSVSGMNIEHSFAKSWWGGSTLQAYYDLHNLYPSDAGANQRKSSHLMSTIDHTVSFDNGVIKVGRTQKKTGHSLMAWEPADMYKGDFARIYMYMVTAYENYAALWTNDSEHLLDNNTYPVFEPWVIDLLLDWCRRDPVSQKEIARNNAIFNIQRNRNPFVDFPFMAEYVWGNRTTIPFTENGLVTYPFLNLPESNHTFTIDTIYLRQNSQITIPVKGTNLTGPLTLTLSGLQAGAFRLSRSTLSKAEAEAGTSVTISFYGQHAGNHAVSLNVSGGGISSTTALVSTFVSGEFKALQASNATYFGFDANWTFNPLANNYLLTVYSKRPTGVFAPALRINEDFTFSLPNYWMRDGYTDQATAGTLRLASISTFGKVSLPPIPNNGNRMRLTVTARQFSNDAASRITVLVDEVELVRWTTGIANQTFSIEIPPQSSATSIALTAIAGKRVLLDLVKIEELVPQMQIQNTLDFIIDDPNVTSFHLTDLYSDSTYFYRVTSMGLQDEISNLVKAKTTLVTSTVSWQNQPVPHVRMQAGRLMFDNFPTHTPVRVYDRVGRLLFVGTNHTVANKVFHKSHKVLLVVWHINSQTASIKLTAF